MNWPSLLQYGVFLLVVIALVKPVGGYMTRVFEGKRTWLDFLLRPLERLIYKLARVDPTLEMNWKQYAVSFVLFGFAGTVLLYLLLRLQHLFPFYAPSYLTTPLSPDLAMNTSVSFATTTTWQAYGGETTMSYFSQLVGLAAQNFLAGAAGLAVGVAFIRGLAREQTDKLGNFWVDLVRSLLWVLLPLSVVASIVLVWQGVPMNFNAYTQATMPGGGSQVIAQGPVAALESIKNLGTNGGGFFNVNGAHPFENPTPFSNFFEMLLIAVLPAAFVNTFGRMTGRLRESWVLLWVMVILFACGLLACGWVEQRGNPRVTREVNQAVMAPQAASVSNLEGKEVRFGIGGSVLTAITTSNGATGSYNSMHDSYTPIGGGVPLANMLLGEIVFGGLGTGLYSVILIALVGLFLAGLMVGRTPEYLGKKIRVTEIKYIMMYTLASPVAVLLMTALAIVTQPGLAGLTTNDGAHGFTEILYAYASSFANNGQNFAGLSANSVFYNVTTAVAMMIGRFGLAIPALALAGSFAMQKRTPASLGTLPAYTFTFGVLVVGTALIVGGLSYFPALALGPIIEHFLMST
ncbi:MAG: potassium-transporting ATPase subunit KdpA [Pyrinomonadaceae bacterium]|nr:potassium-transporting ATPase subunit KdpA [Pyrinomonadaceae bacterium]